MKVLILYNQLFHYRIPIFKLLAEEVQLTVAYSMGKDSNEPLNFKTLKLPIYKYGRFVIHKNNLLRISNKFDVVIIYGDISWLSFVTLPFFKNRKFKVIFWSPGVSASYNKKFDVVTKWDWARDFFYKKADALVFYTSYPIKKYIKRGFCEEKLFVAPNTVEVSPNKHSSIKNKDRLLFIGTLYFQKGILVLLEAYRDAYQENQKILELDIVGGGGELELVKKWVSENKLEHKIVIHGPIYNQEKKSELFELAIACISPQQAGLSVLESFGYGVPFVTMYDAITGGERLNIIHNDNGVLLNNYEELKTLILDASQNKKKYIDMGENAKKYYSVNSRPDLMAKGLLSAINFAFNNFEKK